MDEHGIRNDPDPPPEGPVLDPREARARHRQRTEPSPGLLFLRVLTAEERAWMERMVRRTARSHGVDADDLTQELHLSLLTCGPIEGGRHQVRAWLSRRARWRAGDLLRRDLSRRQRTVSLDEAAGVEPVAAAPVGPDLDWSVERVRALGLNRDEAQVALLVLWGFDVSLKDFAELVERTYVKTRQDKTRALRKIEEMFALEPEESAAVIAYRRYGTFTAAATRLSLPEPELRRRIRRAELKINETLGHAPRSVRGEEGGRDAR